MTTMKDDVIGESGYPPKDGIEIAATAEGIAARAGFDGGYARETVSASWPAVLEHAPTAALRDEILRREDAML